MPLSELYRMARGRTQSSQQKPTSSSTDFSHLCYGFDGRPDNEEFVELVWENGHIMMQGQSSRVRRNTNPNNSQFQIPKFRDRDLGNNPKTGRYGLIASLLDDYTPTVPSSGLGMDQDDEINPWFNFNDPLHSNSISDFLPEFSSVTINDLPHENNMALVNKKNVFNSTFNMNQSLAPSHAQASSSGFSNTSSGIINFSHFSRPAALARADTRNVNIGGLTTSSGVDKTIMPIANETGSSSQHNFLPKTVNTQRSENLEHVVQRDAVRNDMPCQQLDGAGVSKASGEGEKVAEPIVASSSVCSGNNPEQTEQTSDDQNRNLKRKSRETDDSEGRSEDLEEESVGIRKAAQGRGGSGTKRSRAAEVHNLSERRRRDRINEKMRALQELIPNCNKVDKASMLDEAIEYLKTLQLQVQIMSMGAGMYMPHMMLPPGLQHVPGHMAHFPPMMGVGMGMGMGMGMGFGMGMMDMNGGARFHGPRTLPFSGPNFPMMVRPSGPCFGPTGPCFTNPGASNAFGPNVDIPTSAPLPPELTPNHVSLAKEVNEAPPS